MRLLRCVLALAGVTAAGAIKAPAIQMDVKGGETRSAEAFVLGRVPTAVVLGTRH